MITRGGEYVGGVFSAERCTGWVASRVSMGYRLVSVASWIDGSCGSNSSALVSHALFLSQRDCDLHGQSY